MCSDKLSQSTPLGNSQMGRDSKIFYAVLFVYLSFMTIPLYFLPHGSFSISFASENYKNIILQLNVNNLFAIHLQSNAKDTLVDRVGVL